MVFFRPENCVDAQFRMIETPLKWQNERKL